MQDTQDTAYKDIYKATFLMESGIMIESTMHEIILFLNSARETVPSSLFYQTRVFQFEKKGKVRVVPARVEGLDCGFHFFKSAWSLLYFGLLFLFSFL